MTHVAFETSHISVGILYVGGVLALAMFVMQPVYVALSLAGAFAFCLCVVGPRATLAKLRWQLPLLALITLINPLFSASGSTELFRIGLHAIYLESLAYGACMAMMLIAVVLWLEGCARILDPDRLLSVGSRHLPVVALMVSMCARLVPELARRGREVRDVRLACTASGTARESPLKQGARLSTTLMSWAMEDSLERSDTLRARGWGATPRRTSYAAERFGYRDLAALVAIGLLLAANVLLAAVACSQWQFYPKMPTLVPWWGYSLYAVYVALPTVMTLVDRARWHRIEVRVPATQDGSQQWIKLSETRS